MREEHENIGDENDREGDGEEHENNEGGEEDESSGEEDEDSEDEDDGKKVGCICGFYFRLLQVVHMVYYYHHGFALRLVLLSVLHFPLQYRVACSTKVSSVHCRGL